MKREHKTALAVFLFVFFIGINVYDYRISLGNSLVINAEDDWTSYEPITDQNLNSTGLKMLVDSNDNLHLFWNSRNKIENYTQINYELHYSNNDSIKRRTILNVENETYTIIFDVDIDSQNRIHFIYNNHTAMSLFYKIINRNSIEDIDTYQEVQGNFLIVVDSSDTAHLIVKKEANLFDRGYVADEFVFEKQLTSYTLGEEEYNTIYRIKKAKSKQGKIALLFYYSLKAFTPESQDVNEIQCLIYDDYWLHYPAIANYYSVVNNIAFDDTEKLHIIWGHLEEANIINYRTVKGNKWSEIDEITLFEQSSDKQYGIMEIDLEIQGTTRLLCYTASKWLDVGFDLDLYLTYTNDGKTWTNQPIYTNNDSRSYNPLVESTTTGDVFVSAYEDFWSGDSNRTFYLGVQEEFFTYQSTKASIDGLFIMATFVLSTIVLLVKTRKRKS